MDIVSYVLAKGYVNKTLAGMGALAGAPCKIKSITPASGGNNVIFEWRDNNGVLHSSLPMFVADGASAYDIWIEQGNSGTPEDFLNSLKGAGSELKAGVGIALSKDPATNEVTITATGQVTSPIPITQQLQPNEVIDNDDLDLLF